MAYVNKQVFSQSYRVNGGNY